MSSIFTKILEWEIPGDIVFQDETIFVIKDINPLDTTHLLIIPKEELQSINNISEKNKNIVANLFLCWVKLAKELGLKDSYELKMNAWDKQEVPHIHMHLLSDREIK